MLNSRSDARSVASGASLAFALALGALGCDGSGGGGAGGAIAEDDVPARYSEAVCTKAYACCTPMQLMGNTFAGTDQKSCQAQMTGLFQLAVTQWKKSEMAGRVAYHGDNAATCIAAFNAATCTDLNAGADPTATNPACKGTIEPKVALGGACSQTNECIGGSCEGAQTSPAKDGVCKALASSGASCTDASCADGTWCDFSASGGTCKPTKPDGMSCNSSDECTSGGCNGRDTSKGTPGTCGSKVAPGQCFFSATCAVPAGPFPPGSSLAAVGLLGLCLGWARSRRR